MVGFWAAGGLLIAAFMTDIRKRIIPNWLTVSAAGLGLVIYAVEQGWNGLLFSTAGLLCGFLPMLLLYMLRGVGAGDVKLFAALGALTGSAFTLFVMAASLFFAGLIALIVLLCRHDRMKRFGSIIHFFTRLLLVRQLPLKGALASNEALQIPFMWAVAPGVIYSALFWNGWL